MARIGVGLAVLVVVALLTPLGLQEQDKPGEGVWANFDFVPGDTILFYHDFDGTQVGNFPARLAYLDGTGLTVGKYNEGPKATSEIALMDE